MQTQPVEQHAWLRRLVGEWSFQGECAGKPGEEPMRSTGVEVVRPIGGLWIVGESTGDMPGGGPCTTLLTVGFNPKTGRFVGTWIGSMMAHLWVYDGWLEGDELTLEAEGDSFEDPTKVTKYRDITTLVNNNERRFRAMMLTTDGEWKQIMSSVYRRTR